jgi:hypothetical protein
MTLGNSLINIPPISHYRWLLSLPKPRKHEVSILPGKWNLSDHSAMAAPRITFQIFYVLNQPGPEGIQMDVTNELLKISVFVTDDRFIAILKEMAVPAMAEVIGDGIAGQEPTHEL